MDQRETPRPGELYRHFKDKLYQIVGIARHSETMEELVIYQALYGEYGLFARPLSMFLSEVDHEKYPEATQQYRFERVVIASKEEEKPARKEAREEAPNPYLLAFLDADTIPEKLDILRRMSGRVGLSEVESMRAVLELGPGRGSVEEQLTDIRLALQMQGRFEGRGLRERRRRDGI